MDYKTYRSLVPDQMDLEGIRAKLKKALLIVNDNMAKTMSSPESKALYPGNGINFSEPLATEYPGGLIHPHIIIRNNLLRAVKALKQKHAYREMLDPSGTGIIKVKDYTLKTLGCYVYMSNLLSAAIKLDILNEFIYGNVAGRMSQTPERIVEVKSLYNYLVTNPVNEKKYLHVQNDVKITKNNVIALTLNKNYGLVTIPNFKTFGLLGNYVLRSGMEATLPEATQLSNAYADLFASVTLGVEDKPLENLRLARSNLRMKIGGMK